MHTSSNKVENILLMMQLILPLCQDEDNEEMVQIKLLQTIMLFLDPKKLQIDRQLIKLILICIFKLYESQSNLVKNTALATLRQLFSLIFEVKLNNISSNQDSSELFEIAIELLEGLYCTFDKDYENNPNWPLVSNLDSKCLALDLYALCICKCKIFQPKEAVNSSTVYKHHIKDFDSIKLSSHEHKDLSDGDEENKKTNNQDSNEHDDFSASNIESNTQFSNAELLEKDLVEIFSSKLPLFQSFLKDIDEYRFGIRLLRLLNFSLINLHIGLKPLLEFMAEVTDRKPWITRIIFESYSLLFSNAKIVKMILTDKEATGFMENSLASIQKYLEVNKMHLEDQDKSEGKAMPRFLESRMIETEKADTKINQMMILSIETATGLVEVLSNLMFPNGLNSSEVMSSKSWDTEETVITIPFSVSKFIIRMLSILLDKSSKDISIQSILNSIQVYINMAGLKHMNKERDAFIRELCMFCTQSDVVVDKQILACKTLFNVAHWMPDILEADSWRIIMNAMHRIENMVQKYLDSGNKKQDKPDFVKLRKNVSDRIMSNPAIPKEMKDERQINTFYALPSSETIRSINPTTRTSLEKKSPRATKDEAFKYTQAAKSSDDIGSIYPDLEILQSALDSLFTSTYIYEDHLLIEFLRGLGKLTINMLEENSETKAVIPTKKKQTAIFGIVKILEVTLINMTRIDLIWDTVVVNELSLISSCKHEWLNTVAMEAICVIILDLLDRRVRTQQIRMEMDIEEAVNQKVILEDAKELDEEWIVKIFEPLHKQMDTDFDKNKNIILTTIESVIQKHGNYLNNSIWNNILKVLVKTSSKRTESCV